VQLLEEALMESDQHVVKAAFLVEIEAVGSCCIFLGTWMLYPEPDTAVIKTTWVLLWILEHGNLSGWRVVASGFWRLMLPHLLIVQVHGIEWGYLSLKSRENLVASGVWKLEVSGWRWSLGLWKTWGGLLQGVTAAYCCTWIHFSLNVNDRLSPSGFWKAQRYLLVGTLFSGHSAPKGAGS